MAEENESEFILTDPKQPSTPFKLKSETILPEGYTLVYSCPACQQEFENQDHCQEHTLNCNVASLQEIQQMYVDKILEQELSKSTKEELESSKTKNCKRKMDVTIENSNKKTSTSNFDASSQLKKLEKFGTIVVEKSSSQQNDQIIVIKQNDLSNDSKAISTIKKQNGTNNAREITPRTPKNQTIHSKKDNVIDHKSNKKKKTFFDRISKIAPVKTKDEEQDEDTKVYEFHDAEMEARVMKAKLAELNKPRTCNFCEKLFDDPMDVLRHKREAHRFQRKYLPEKELEQYLHVKDKTKCPICNRPIKGGYQSVFEKHLMTHKEEYSYQCKICNMMFRRLDHKQQHEARHII